MPLLLDSDGLCKFGSAGLLEAAVSEVGSSLADCRRLAALPHMLRRGRMRQMLGEVRSEALLPVVQAIAEAPIPSPRWADPLIGVSDIDPGEAQLLALTAEHDARLLTGDKRSLKAVLQVPGYAEALAGKVVLVDYLWLRLCMRLGDDAVRQKVVESGLADVMLNVVFSPDNPAPRTALESYVNSARTDLQGLALWAQAAGVQGAP